MKTSLETLRELREVVDGSISMLEIGECEFPVSPKEISDFKNLYGECDIVLGDFKITRISTRETCEQFNARVRPLKEAYRAMSEAYKKVFPNEP